MSELNTTPKAEHWKTREAREKKELESKGLPPEAPKTTPQPPKNTISSSNKPRPIVRAFQEEFYYYVQVRINRKPSITNARQPFFNQRTLHPGIDTINHPEYGNRTIRYVLGEKSIFKDEQSSSVEDKHVTPIIFEEGLCQVGYMEKNLKLFLDLCNANIGSPNRRPGSRNALAFVLYDPKKNAKEVYDKDLELAKALVYFNDQSQSDEGIENLMAYAETLKLDMNRSWSEIKADLSQFLKRDANKFLEGLKSPGMKRKYIVMQALKLGSLIVDSNSGTISWPNGQGLCTPPIGIDPVDYFVQWSFDKGQNSYDHIKQETENLLFSRI